MANLIGALADIGEVYLEGEKEICNEAFKYSSSLKVYLFDIETKELVPNLNIRPEDFIVCRNTKKKADLSSPYLYPVEEIKTNCLKKDKNDVFFLKKTINTFLSYFSDDEKKNNNILSLLKNIDDAFLNKFEEEIKSINIDKKYKNYLALSYQGNPISKLFPQVFDIFLNKSEPSTSYGYDILANVEGVGADASLLFCSLNEMVEKSTKAIESFAIKEKARRLPLNETSARKIQLGFEKLENISCDIDGSEIKMAILPTVLSKDKKTLKKIIKIIENEAEQAKATPEKVRKIENKVMRFLNSTAEGESKDEIKNSVLNTLLFYTKNKSKMVLSLTIDDVLPSYVSFVSGVMGKYNIHSFNGEGIWNENDSLENRALFLSFLFKNNRVKKSKGSEQGNGNQKTQNQLKTMEFLFSRRKIKTGDIIRLYAEAIVNNGNRPFLWTDYFNDFYNNRDSFPVPAIERLHLFFNEIEILTEIINIGRKKMKDFTEEELLSIVQSSEFLKQSNLHQAAYLLGILSQAIYRWQQNVRGDYTSQTAFSKFINRNRQITKDKLLEINQECVKTIGKLLSQSEGSRRVDVASSVLLPILAEAAVYNKIVKKEELTLAFAFGGRDFESYRKLQNQNKASEKENLPQPNSNIVDNAHKQEQSLFNF